MIITLAVTAECADCGAPYNGFSVRTVRVNKLSIRTTDNFGLMAGKSDCDHHQVPIDDVMYKITDEDQKRIDEYRARKWPVKADAR